MATSATPTHAPRTATSVAVTSISTATITFSDGTKSEYSGSLFDIVANREAPPAMVHTALTAFHATAVATATQTGANAATAAMEPGHAKLASLFAKGALAPDDIKAGAAIVADLRKTARERALAKAQKAAADAQAALSALQAS